MRLAPGGEARPAVFLDAGVRTAGSARFEGERVWVTEGELTRALGYHLSAGGLCLGERCFPIEDRSALTQGGWVELRGVARATERPIVIDADLAVVSLGVAAPERRERLASRRAPELTLPDLDGAPRSLSALRGRKVMLLAFASW